MSTPNEWLNCKQISHININSPVHTGGRVPWYTTSTKSRKHKQTFLIGVGGGTASGKTSVCKAIVNHLQLPWVQILSMDCFYLPLSPSDRANVSNYNFDHPNAFDWDLLLNVLQELKQGKAVKCPQYDFTTHSRKSEYTLMYGADVVLCEGILMLHNPDILSQFDVKVFVKTDDDIRLIRRIKRDMSERGRTLDGILKQYQKTVKPSYMLFCEPTQTSADIVIPRGRDNIVAINLLCDHIRNKLIEGGNVNPIFYKQNTTTTTTTQSYANDNDINVDIPENVMLPDKNDNKLCNAVNELHNESINGKQLLQCISILCNGLITLCINQFMPRRLFTPSPCSPKQTPIAMSANESPENINININMTDNESVEIVYFDSDDKESEIKENSQGSKDSDIMNPIQTINNIINTISLTDEKCASQKCEVCVVTIFSGGMLFGESIMDEMGNNELFKVDYGSIHIFHESKKPAKPRFYDRQLPHNISQQKVIMVDAFIGTGNRARMALQVLIDHHVPENNICFITLVSSQDGITNLAKVFPNVQFITARIDHIGKDKHWETVPVTSSLVVKYCKAAGIDIVEKH